MLISDARQAIKEEAPLDRIRTLTSDLQQIYQSLTAAQTTAGPGTQPGGPGGPGTGPGGTPQTPTDDDVIDADFTTE
jgi:molecular chaperone DnaK